MNKALSITSKLRTGEYKKSTRLFFNPSKLFEAQITELFDEVWPTVTALKSLRWQVKGYYQEYGIDNNSGLKSKFVEKEDRTNRPNLYRTCIEESWSDMEFRITKNLLTNIFACYEGWAEQMVTILQWEKKRTKELQFPLSFPNNLIEEKKVGGNVDLIKAFYNEYRVHSRLYNWPLINNWLLLYRYFKECRNAIIHNGGQTTQKVIDSYLSINTLTTTDLAVDEVPVTISSDLGKQLELSLRGVIGFSQITLKLVSTFDIEMIQCENADIYFANTIKSNIGYNLPMRFRQDQKAKEIRSIIQKNYFVKPADIDAAFRLLTSSGIFKE